MSNEISFIQNIIRDLKLVSGDQVRLDEIYMVKWGLKVVNCSRELKNQPWFTASLVECRKAIHKFEVR